jgi:hypothetical protein
MENRGGMISTGETEEIAEKPVAVLVYPPHFSRVLNGVSAVKGQRLTELKCYSVLILRSVNMRLLQLTEIIFNLPISLDTGTHSLCCDCFQQCG